MVNCLHPHAQLEHAWAHCEQLHEHHNAHWREHCAVLSTPRTVCWCTCVHTSHLWLKSRLVCHSMSSMHAHLCLVSWVVSPHPSLYFFLQFLFPAPDEISMEDPLCDSSLGSMVTLDYVNPLTFPKDRNCEICKRTKITRAPCRRRKGEAVPRADNFGDLITADHKVLSDNCESRNNHRYAVVVQDVATQWIQAYPCKNKTSQETQRSLQKFLEPDRKLKSFTLTMCWNSAKLVKIFHGIIARLHHTDRRLMVLRKEHCACKGRHFCCIAAIGSKWKLVGRFNGMLHLSAKRHRFIVWWEDALWKTFGWSHLM